MGKKKKKRRTRTIPLAPTVALFSTVARPAPSGRTIIGDITSMNIENLLYDAREIYAGVDNRGRIRPEWLVQTYGPVIAGALIHKLMNMIGVNKYFQNLPSPLNKVRI